MGNADDVFSSAAREGRVAARRLLKARGLGPSSGSIIARRIQSECGVEIIGSVPTRAHHKRHGEIADTFLVTEECSARGKVMLDEQVRWRWQGRVGFRIALQGEVPANKLARAKRLKVEISDPCGYESLLVSDADYVVSARGRSTLNDEASIKPTSRQSTSNDE
jgi:hypothetical protein